MSSQQGKKHKTSIPVVKSVPNNARQGDEAVFIRSYSKTSQPESQQGRRNIQVSFGGKSVANNDGGIKKSQGPETWIDEVTESQSQKLRSSVQSEHKKRREDMEKHLQEAETQLATMAKLLEQREKMAKEAGEEADKRTAELENKLLTQDGHLIRHGIDPVTGEQIVLDEKDEKKVESTKKFTKKKVQEMREQLRQMNNETESYLTEVENALKFLNSLESAYDKVGLSKEDAWMQFVATEIKDDIAELYTENQVTASGAAGVEIFASANRKHLIKNQEIDSSESDPDNKKFFITDNDELYSPPDESSGSVCEIEDKVL